MYLGGVLGQAFPIVASGSLIEILLAPRRHLCELLVCELQLPRRAADLVRTLPGRVRRELASDERPEPAGTSPRLVAGEGWSGGSCESTRPEATHRANGEFARSRRLGGAR